ncbi:hypothetical protein M2323_000027 [Rhodoblastus acidophilus]|uniref:hypothetical protein n=1 Tax=Rhodoblastus acidophilus TaxID=1074 RepID=UPI0022241A9F|nr:hypothetical protein [Rhodoblastus acidophilus]MCW2282466.1 hypothetical protein [Rhodoblastus acidophilus]MCW2331129.1 hypothetical protein [Rhodoblastus acidophilus]
MARSNKFALMAAPLCAAALLAAPAWAGDSLFDSPGAPAVEAAPKPAVKKKPVVKHKPAKPAEAAKVEPAPEPAPAPVVVEPEPQTAFGQQMPRQSLINRMTNPAPAPGPVGSSGGPGGQGDKAAAPVEPEEETLPNGMPKKFLLNKLFDSSALEPARQPDPRSFMAQAPAAPAAEPSLFDRAAGALGFADKEEKPAGNLPPVNVTAPPPAKPDRKPKEAKPASTPAAAPPPAAAVTPPPAAAPSPPGWFDRALGGGDETTPDYSERPKLAIPQNRDALPAPRPGEERRVQRPLNAEALTRPPSGYLDKVQGADGKVSGFTDQDEGKKGFFNWF